MTVNGTYRLASVNGKDVPTVWRDVTAGNGDRIRSYWTGGRVVLCPTGCYSVSLRSTLRVGYRDDPVGTLRLGGTWRPGRSGEIELISDRGGVGRWLLSSDQSVLVANADHEGMVGNPGRTTFVFLREPPGPSLPEAV